MYLKKIVVLVSILLFTACAKIPSEAPQLSIALGKKISSIESTHIKLLNKFFDDKREDVEQFVENEWMPIFVKKVFSNVTVEKYWNKIISEFAKALV